MRNVSHLLYEQEYTEQVYTGGPNFDGQSAINRLKSQEHSSTWLGGEVSHWMWGKHEKYMRDYSRVVGRIQEELWNKRGNILHAMKRRYSGFVGLGQKVWLQHLESGISTVRHIASTRVFHQERLPTGMVRETVKSYWWLPKRLLMMLNLPVGLPKLDRVCAFWTRVVESVKIRVLQDPVHSSRSLFQERCLHEVVIPDSKF